MESRSVDIPESLFNRIEARIRGSKFASVSEFVTYALREKLVSEEEGSETAFTEDEERRIKDRLRSLGYL